MVMYTLLLVAMFIVDLMKVDPRYLLVLSMVLLIIYRSMHHIRTRFLGFVMMFDNKRNHPLDYFMCFVMLTFVYYKMGWLSYWETFITYPFSFVFFYHFMFKGNTKKGLDA